MLQSSRYSREHIKATAIAESPPPKLGLVSVTLFGRLVLPAPPLVAVVVPRIGGGRPLGSGDPAGIPDEEIEPGAGDRAANPIEGGENLNTE